MHAIGGLATLVLLYGITQRLLLQVLHSEADNTVRVSILLADIVLAPLLFIRPSAPLRRSGGPRRHDARVQEGGSSSSAGRAAACAVGSCHRLEEEDTVALYLMLTTLTEKGVQTLNSNPARVREVNRDVEELGAKILHQWASLGAYDFVNVVEAPDDLTIARVSVALGARGSSKIESLPLVSVDDLLTSLAG